jgi:hypothetical protein
MHSATSKVNNDMNYVITTVLRNLILHITPSYRICNTNVLHSVFICQLSLRIVSTSVIGRLQGASKFVQLMSTLFGINFTYIIKIKYNIKIFLKTRHYFIRDKN